MLVPSPGIFQTSPVPLEPLPQAKHLYAALGVFSAPQREQQQPPDSDHLPGSSVLPGQRHGHLADGKRPFIHLPRLAKLAAAVGADWPADLCPKRENRAADRPDRRKDIV